MPRRWLQQRLPTHQQLHEQLGVDTTGKQQQSRVMHWVRNKLADPMLWHLNRRSVAGAVAVGLFIGWLPVPMQMLIAALLAATLRVHVPVSVVLVWFSNPITFPALLYAAWFIGSSILGTSMLTAPLSMNVLALLKTTASAWPIILFGSLFCATLFSVLGYVLTNALWRMMAMRRWRARAHRHHKPLDKVP